MHKLNPICVVVDDIANDRKLFLHIPEFKYAAMLVADGKSIVCLETMLRMIEDYDNEKCRDKITRTRLHHDGNFSNISAKISKDNEVLQRGMQVTYFLSYVI